MPGPLKNTRIRFWLLLTGVIVGLVLASTGAARNAPERISDGTIRPSEYTPLGLSQGPVRVMVQLSGETVAEVQERANRRLSRQEKQQVKATLRQKQDTLRPSVQQLGGQVTSDFQSAFNGMGVQIARDKVDDLARLPQVVSVRPVRIIKRLNTVGVPYIGAPETWDLPPGLLGEGVKIAVADTGIDYTHANFGGPGTPEAFDQADATDTLPPDPALVGPAAPKVKGGIDLVGDDYDAGGTPDQQIPKPDPNPLDCDGHGSHVSGTATGFGVLSSGETYTGPYDSSIYDSTSFEIGPGVAPRADLYGVRVFGCFGSATVEVVVAAIEWAVDNDMDVLNMSLGDDLGGPDDADAIASNNAVRAGVVVVAAAGNAGPSPYIHGSPAAATRAISVAAVDPHPGFAGVSLALSTGETVIALNSNAATIVDGTSMPMKRIFDDPATADVDESLGCNESDYADAVGALAVVDRGVCARVHKAIVGQKAGAAAVAMINNAPGYPPFEGAITVDPDTGEEFTVTIPFLGILGPPSPDGETLGAADGGSATLSNTTIDNPNFTGFASFTSGGPRKSDSWLKPDVSAPGVSIRSTGIATGNKGTIISGTSMATPHVAGVAALTRQAHPRWRATAIKAAIVSTGQPSAIAGYQVRRGGTGLVQPLAAAQTSTVAFGTEGAAALNFGFRELRDDFSGTRRIELRNNGSSPATFDVSTSNATTGSPHTATPASTQVTVPAGGEVQLKVRLDVPAASVGNSTAFREVGGLVVLTPHTSADNAGVALRVPYYLVPRALSLVESQVRERRLPPSSPTTTAIVRNRAGAAIAGDADFYAWGLEDPKDAGRVSNDIRALGVQVFPFPSDADPTERLLVFAVNTWDRWSTAATNEFDVFVDVDNDGVDDYVVVGVDLGAVTAGAFNGVIGSFVFSLRSPGFSIEFLADAPTDSTSLLLPVLTGQLCREGEPCLAEATNPRFTYRAISFDILTGGFDAVADQAKFNAWTPAISQGDFLADIAPGSSATSTVTIDPAEWALTPAKGVMIVTTDDRAGRDEADLLPVGLR